MTVKIHFIGVDKNLFHSFIFTFDRCGISEYFYKMLPNFKFTRFKDNRSDFGVSTENCVEFWSFIKCFNLYMLIELIWKKKSRAKIPRLILYE